MNKKIYTIYKVNRFLQIITTKVGQELLWCCVFRKVNWKKSEIHKLLSKWSGRGKAITSLVTATKCPVTTTISHQKN